MDYSQILQQSSESMSQELEDKYKRELSSLNWLQRQLPGWKRNYLKRNQPKNYFRVTRLVPPGFEDGNPDTFWLHKFQVFVKGKLDHEFFITSEAFDFYMSNPEWEEGDSLGVNYSILKPKGLCQ